jgi:short-chain fatty acids transporter
MAVVLIAISVVVAWASCPPPELARTAEEMGVRFEPLAIALEPPTTPAEKLDASPFFSVAVAVLMLAYLVQQIREKGPLAVADLNNFNFAFLTLGLLLHGRPRSFLRAVARSVPATAGVLIQTRSTRASSASSRRPPSPPFCRLFHCATTRARSRSWSPSIQRCSGCLPPGEVDRGAPYDGGGERLHLGWTVQIYNAARRSRNLINPF